MLTLRRYQPGEVIIEENDIGETAYIIETGRVERRVETVDVAPTIAAYLRVRPPSGSRGRVMEEVTASSLDD